MQLYLDWFSKIYVVFENSFVKFALLIIVLEQIIDNFVLKEGGNVTPSKLLN